MARTKFIRMPAMKAAHAGRNGQLAAIKKAMDGESATPAVLFGPHGSGKSCTAAYAATGLLDKEFEYAYAFDCRGGLSGEEFLVRICQFLEHNNVGNFQNIALSPIPYQMKIDFIGKILDKTALLIVLDGYEPGIGRGTSNMKAAIRRISTCPNGGTRLIITTTGRLDIEAEHIEFGPMDKADASAMLRAYASINEDDSLIQAVYNAADGSPFLMDLISRSPEPAGLIAEIRTPGDIVALVASRLKSEGAESIIAQASGYERAVNKEGVAIPDTIENDMEELLASGLIEDIGAGFYSVPSLVRHYYKETMDDAVWRERLKGCALFHEAYSRKEGIIWHALHAHSLYTQAAEPESAARLSLFLFETLLGWGLSDLMSELCAISLQSATGPLRAAILNFCALLKQSQRKASESIEMYKESLSIYEAEDNKPAMASTLDYLGRAYHDSGDSDKALESLARASVLYDSLGNLKALALAHLQIGRIHHDKRDLRTATMNYDKCMALLDEVQDKSISATALHQIGIAHIEHKDYKSALSSLIVSLAIYTHLKSPAKTNVTAAIKRIEEAIGAENINKLNDEVIQELKSRGKEGTA